MPRGLAAPVVAVAPVTPPPGAWWLCPNLPRCGHPAVLHDIEEYDDPVPRCCVDGCRCGAVHGPARPDEVAR